MSAKEFDQFYTEDSTAVSCMSNVLKVLSELQVDRTKVFYLEPSAGDGAFMRASAAVDVRSGYGCFGCDIDPKGQNIVKCDFLADDISVHLPTNRIIVVVGNPPFGKKGKLASAFVNKAFLYSQIVCFVLPIQFNKFSGHNQIIPQAKLVFNEPLEDNCFVFNGKPYSVRSCFQVWTSMETSLPDMRIRTSPKTRHPDFEMFQYNCTEEAAKFFDKQTYKWDFAVPRQGFKDYTVKETDPDKLDRRIQWIFFRAKNKKILGRLKKIDFEKLSLKNSTIPGFGKADVVEEYIRCYGEASSNSLKQAELDLK